MTAVVPLVDDAVREYLLFRGFTQTLKYYDVEMKQDKDKGFQIDKLVNYIFSFVSSYDLQGLLAVWGHLEQRFFGKLGEPFVSSARKLEACLKRYYIVNAVQSGRTDKCIEFFEKLAPELQHQADWQDWFSKSVAKLISFLIITALLPLAKLLTCCCLYS